MHPMELVANLGSAKLLAWEAGPNHIHGGRRRPHCHVRNVSKSFCKNSVFAVCQQGVISEAAVYYPASPSPAHIIGLVIS